MGIIFVSIAGKSHMINEAKFMIIKTKKLNAGRMVALHGIPPVGTCWMLREAYGSLRITYSGGEGGSSGCPNRPIEAANDVSYVTRHRICAPPLRSSMNIRLVRNALSRAHLVPLPPPSFWLYATTICGSTQQQVPFGCPSLSTCTLYHKRIPPSIYP